MTLLGSLIGGALRPSGGFDDLARLHLPFDSILETDAYERSALEDVLAGDATLAVRGEPGAGKSSLIAHVARTLPESHIPILIRGRTLGDPGDLDHFLEALLRSALRALGATDVPTEAAERASHDSVAETSTSPSATASVGGGGIPAQLSVELGSLATESQRELKDFDRMDGSNALSRRVSRISAFRCSSCTTSRRILARAPASSRSRRSSSAWSEPW